MISKVFSFCLAFIWLPCLMQAQVGDDELQQIIDSVSVVGSEDDEVTIEYDEECDYEEDDYEDEEEEAFILREVDEKKWAAYKKDKRFKYKIKKEKKKKKVDPWFPDLSFLNSKAFKYFLYFVVAGFLLFIIYLFVKNNQISFKRKRKKKKEVEAPWEEVEKFDDWDNALQQAESEKNYRLATRILYLRNLQELNTNNLIVYREDKTNWMYVQHLYKSAYHEPFKELTTYFDYIWYGGYEIEEGQYFKVKDSFVNFKKMIVG